mmetsp:Transcript_23265/g.46319  ORF Transcript_23265/g.46319 Transcript_23265/m.46319 type:complete len:219 (-) Transcript_23265:218-874(-)|eukprot:CAMPEP_0182478406 /NCGR_PEP_ID=MMETSP1319-20130603/32450_1 /TAXON_ID=172717 /ORGANISM="Bolidomonas pacifica, Strain RCC208" /LENGTH=218 /DNA_ID=CAMNT_0024679743 /DNA_START=27 /DNA_END=683 /DNA_ORIENTATION=+
MDPNSGKKDYFADVGKGLYETPPSANNNNIFHTYQPTQPSPTYASNAGFVSNVSTPTPMIMVDAGHRQFQSAPVTVSGEGGSSWELYVALTLDKAGDQKAAVADMQNKMDVPDFFSSSQMHASDWASIKHQILELQRCNVFYECPRGETLFYCFPGLCFQTLLCTLNPISCICIFAPWEEGKKKFRENTQELLEKYKITAEVSDPLCTLKGPKIIFRK